MVDLASGGLKERSIANEESQKGSTLVFQRIVLACCCYVVSEIGLFSRVNRKLVLDAREPRCEVFGKKTNQESGI